MATDCYTSDDFIEILLNFEISDLKKRKFFEHIKECPKCARAFDLTAKSLNEILSGWSGKTDDCPDFDTIYNTIFGLPGGMSSRELERHILWCPACKEEYELIKLSPHPDEIPVDSPETEYSSDFVNSITQGVMEHFEKAKAPGQKKPPVLEGLSRKVGEFLEKLKDEATVISGRLELCTNFRGTQKEFIPKELPGFEIKTSHRELFISVSGIICDSLNIKVFNPKNELVASAKGTAPGVIPIELDQPGTYYIFVHDNYGTYYNLQIN